MVAVQASGCAPIVKAYDEGVEHAELWTNAHTVASGIRVPIAIGDFLNLRAALPYHLKAFVTFAYKVGWRDTEIAGLTWSQVDRVQGIVRLEVGETKNDDGRTVYLDEELMELFSDLWEARKQNGKLIPYVFPNHEGDGPIRDFRGAWNTACRLWLMSQRRGLPPRRVNR